MSGECILIIDDSQEMVKHLSAQLLPALGFKTLQATNGQEGLQLIREKRPALVMLDLNLPRMTGLDVLQTMAAESLDIPVILMTGYGSEKSAIEAFRLGIKDYLVKPFTVEEVLTAIDRVLMEGRLRHDQERLIEQLRRAERDAHRQLAELNTLMEMGKEIMMLCTPAEIIDRALERAIQVVGAEKAALWLEVADGAILQAYSQGTENLRQPQLDCPAGTSLVRTVWQSGQVVRDSAFGGQGVEIVPGFFARAVLLAPLRVREQTIGVIGTTNHIAPQAFGEREQGMLNSLAEFVAIALDNARRLKARQNTAPAEELESLKSNFVMTVSHDLRAPLNSVIGFASALQSSSPLDERQSLFVQHIIDSAQRMMNLVNVLLDLARLEAGLTEPQELCDIMAIVDNVVTDLQGKAWPKEIQLSVNRIGKVRPVWGNPARLAQAISNLVDNALKFSPHGETVRISVEQHDQFLEVVVEDKGPGIPEQDLPYIFDRFYRVPDMQNVEGTGLGLTLVRTIAEAYGGRVLVESRPGKGSTFRLWLPQQEPAAKNQGLS